MCTITYTPSLQHAGKAERWIFFNRDERRSRAEAHAPKIFTGKGGRYISPIDPEGGGTWLGLHDKGWFISLLNYYPEDQLIYGPQFRSRGLLVKDILDRGRTPEEKEMKKIVQDNSYPPFSLYILWKDRSVLYQWDQLSLTVNLEGVGFLTSSGFQNSRIYPLREAQFLGLQSREEKVLRSFHRRKHPRGDEGIWMERPDACTRSITEILLGPNSGELLYYPTPPFETGQKTTLPWSTVP
jgi:uncharacterized protein with NRDE domain